MKKLSLIWLFFCVVVMLPFAANAQLFNYKDYYSQQSYGVTKRDNLKYGVASTNYYLYKGTGSKTSRSNYRYVPLIDLTLDLFEPNMSANSGKRAVLIMIPGSGRDGCVLKDFCTKDTVRENSISTNNEYYVSQEGNDYNELITKNGLGNGFASRGMVVISPNTRYKYHNRRYDKVPTANLWTRPDGSSLLNGSSTHLELLVVDIKRVVRWLSHPTQANKYNIDPNNIFIYGSSGAAKMASLAAITGTNVLTADDPEFLKTSNPNHQFEVNNNNLSVAQKPLRGAILLAGDTNGTRNLQFINSNTGAFMFWHGTVDRSVLHGMAETIEEKCEYVGCDTQFYSLPGVIHEKTTSGKALHTKGGNSPVRIQAHIHDFIVNHLDKGNDNRAVLSINPNKVAFRENTGTAKIEVTLSRALTSPVSFTIAADQMREVTQQNGAQGQYSFIQSYVANDSASAGPVIYDQGTGVAFEKESNLPNKYKGLDVFTSGPGEDKPVLIPLNSKYFNSDFNGKKQILTIAAGKTTATFNVNLVNDSLQEQNECFKVRLLNAQGARIGNSVETITILDDDSNVGNTISPTCRNPGTSPPPPPNTPNVSVVSKAIPESAGVASIQIKSDIPVPADVTLSYRTVSDTASSSNGDFVAKQGQVTLAKGKTNVFVPITIKNDTDVEENETFNLELTSVVSGKAVISNARGIVTIVNDDVAKASLSVSDGFISEGSSPVNVRVLADQVLSKDVTFSYKTINGSAKSGSDYVAKQGQATIKASQGQVFIPIRILNDTAVESDETFSLEITSITSGQATIGSARGSITIVNDDSVIKPTVSVLPVNVKESSGQVVVTITADQNVPEDIFVKYRTVVGTASSSDNDYEYKEGTVKIAQSTDKVFVPIVINNDSRVEGIETFSLRITDIVSNNAEIGSSNGLITIYENNIVVRPGISVLSQNVGEASGKAFLQVVADGVVDADTRFQYQTIVGSATSGDGDYKFKKDFATIVAGRDRVTIPIEITNDNLVEGPESFKVRILNVSTGNADILSSDATVTIIDDDKVIRSSIVVRSMFVNEGSGVAVVSVLADRMVDENIVLNFRTITGTASSRKRDYTYREGKVILKKGRDEAFVSIQINDDAAIEGTENFQLELTEVLSGDAVIASRRGTITIIDNDSAKVNAEVSVAPSTVFEDNGKARIRVELDKVKGEDVVVSYRTISRTAKENTDYRGASGNVVIESGKTSAYISIDIVDDKIIESEEKFVVSLGSVISGEASIDVGNATITIFDNDTPFNPGSIIPAIDLLLK